MREDLGNSVQENATNSLVFSKDSLNRVLDLFNGFQWRVRPNTCTHSKTSINQCNELVVEEEPVSLRLRITDLPIAVLLEIFSKLDVISLCRAAQTCQVWYTLSNDNLLWEHKLKLDSNHWEMIDHLSHPDQHLNLNPELSFKQIYLQCCPEYRLRREYEKLSKFIPNLRFYFGFTIPRVVMFGSGLDSNDFVRSLLWEKKSPFTVKKMFPGQFEGLGSGFTLQYSGGSMNLITLYRMSKAERENEGVNDGRVSKLLVPDVEDENRITLSHPARELCSSIDAFIYVVKAHDINKVCFGSEEFQAMLDTRWVNPKVPVLVLCLTADHTVKSVSSLEVANKLNLLNLARPWQVRQCHSSSMYGVLPGVNWFIKRIMTM